MGLRDRKKLATWRAIHLAAVKLFVERGYEAVSVDDIAAAADVSPSTFFNYFPTKEAVVFDLDPADAAAVKELMEARPPDEPLWTSLSEILMGYMAALGPRVATQKKLKAASPTLTASGRELGARIRDDLMQWTATRRPKTPALQSSLLVNLSIAAVLTALSVWDADADVSEFLSMARRCLKLTGEGVAGSSR